MRAPEVCLWWGLLLCTSAGARMLPESAQGNFDYDQEYGVHGYVPVLGVGVLHDPNMFLTRLIYSIDFPIKHLVVYYNEEDPVVQLQLKHVAANHEALFAIPTQAPMGVAEGWNAMLHAFPEERWFLLVAYDIQFLPGSLEVLAQQFAGSGQCQAHMVTANFHGSGARYNTIALSADLINRAGYFDENCFPAFFEDTEWKIRIRRLTEPLCKPVYIANATYIHGFRRDTDYITGTKRLGNNDSQSLVTVGHRVNGWYVAEKWGCPPPYYVDWGRCEYLHPWNNSAYSLSYWQKNMTLRQEILNAARPDDIMAKL